ncbi:hypothetical protein LX36DRAFT_131578 [Colletotrichum falcatum]|nr:hypothetical protein LX36DRAFT_131578 [Colletotrichum falcatum]
MAANTMAFWGSLASPRSPRVTLLQADRRLPWYRVVASSRWRHTPGLRILQSGILGGYGAPYSTYCKGIPGRVPCTNLPERRDCVFNIRESAGGGQANRGGLCPVPRVFHAGALLDPA